MPRAAGFRDNWKANDLCLNCGRERDGAVDRCSLCLASIAVSAAKTRAKKKNLSFSLTRSWLLENTSQHCPCCSVKMERGGDRSSSPSIDRRDNSRGYEPDNCWVICFACNEAKSSSENPESLIQQAERMLRVAKVWRACDSNLVSVTG